METAIPYFMTIRMIWINNYSLTPLRGLFEILTGLTKGGTTRAGGKLSIFGTTESYHKFGHGDCYTILYDHNNDSDQ